MKIVINLPSQVLQKEVADAILIAIKGLRMLNKEKQDAITQQNSTLLGKFMKFMTDDTTIDVTCLSIWEMESDISKLRAIDLLIKDAVSVGASYLELSDKELKLIKFYSCGE